MSDVFEVSTPPLAPSPQLHITENNLIHERERKGESKYKFSSFSKSSPGSEPEASPWFPQPSSDRWGQVGTGSQVSRPSVFSDFSLCGRTLLGNPQTSMLVPKLVFSHCFLLKTTHII